MNETLERIISYSIQIITLIIAFSALLISLTQSRRGRRQANEDIIFQNKLLAYSEIVKRTFDFLDNSFSLLDEIPDFEGTKDEWSNVKMPELFQHYYPFITENKSIFVEYTTFLPDEFVIKFEEFSFKATRLLVELHHFDNEHSIETYLTLQNLHADLLTIARKDLSVDVLNTKLLYRLSE